MPKARLTIDEWDPLTFCFLPDQGKPLTVATFNDRRWNGYDENLRVATGTKLNAQSLSDAATEVSESAS